MWVHEMEAIQKAAYGFVKITKEDLIKLGIAKKDESKKDEESNDD